MFVNSLLYRQLRRLPEILILDWFSTLCTDTPSPQEKSGEEATSPIFPEGKGGGGVCTHAIGFLPKNSLLTVGFFQQYDKNSRDSALFMVLFSSNIFKKDKNKY